MRKPHTRWSRVTLIGIGASLIVGVFVLAFSWPSVTSSVHGIPVVVAGSGPAADAVAAQLTQAPAGAGAAGGADAGASGPDAGGSDAGADAATFVVTRVESRDDAVTAVESRDAYGAIVVASVAAASGTGASGTGASGIGTGTAASGTGAPAAPAAAPEVLTASANGLVVSQIFTGVAAQIQAALTEQLTAQGVPPAAVPTVEVTDLVPLAAGDPRGTGLSTLSFPLVVGGMIGGVVVTLLIAGVWRRLAASVVYGLASGVIVVAVTQGWFGVMQGDAVLNVIAVAAAVLAITVFIVGMTSLIGPRGIAVGAILSLLVGNPISGSAQPWQFLPEPWGAIGQWFPPGAGATLMRDLAYFPAASTLFPWLVLAGWIALGVVLSAIGHFRDRALLASPAAFEEAPDPASGQSQRLRLKTL
ncbi:hypothetical protein ACEXOS_016850 [Herbiconiux sp. P16]|uniref:hypothetical protein n=1 Tax=Herbiconiux wuyangfengii TaxID=3342794 RepID=UPI0035B7F6D8